MKILFDLCHPAHFHLFKNFIHFLRENNHDFLIGVRKKDILCQLLDHEKIPYKVVGKVRKGKWGNALELIERNIVFYQMARSFKPDLLMGTSVNLAQVSQLIRRDMLFFNEDDAKIVPIVSKIGYPFSKFVIKPDCLSYEKGANSIYHNSCHELAYLHPNHFEPNESVLSKYHLHPKKYVVLRLSALEAHHDSGVKGITQHFVNRLEQKLKNYQIVKSIENDQTFQVDPWDMHHIMAFSKMIISDSQTMTHEASVLGVPSIRVNSFKSKISYINEAEKKYGLTFSFYPLEEDEIIHKMETLLEDKNVIKRILAGHKRYLNNKCDFNRWMIQFFEKYYTSQC